ncbi:MAG: hypothetical protein A2406_01225 [Candidatus Komeilibacteria bacterium RIFOXYC1_FULL_37_11]|uniref:Type IV pilus modification protein PilV n=1 Tax=Candidatus Komeilibacteria bacterium RIFOXYC1_FULL_37_11 TaxID=1798555 RepID=A0A1G2BVS4_9BACT|nr:MAG: hypothetical protein A2406_01225 [Candidatus Komeilibacteria bacterium RIFOXYC1_FULL_37_11]OGY95767.1 MAG: hypothetical protein A2611_03250 [Candidatus Komeilibacteria bacterium RIFOXYD1_FULL_37_29]
MLATKDNIKFTPRYLARPSSEGFTLIETLISIVVFTIGIFAALGLSVSNYNDSQNNLDRIIATNLAREGVELVKNVRDSNWLKIEANDTAGCGGSSCTWNYALNGLTDYVVMSYASTTPNFLPACALGIVECIKNNASTQLSINATNYYVHGNNNTTKYSRAIKLEKICLESEGEIPINSPNPQNFEYLRSMSQDCNVSVGDTQIGLKLTAHVQWEDGSTKYIEIVDSIYNWRR